MKQFQLITILIFFIQINYYIYAKSFSYDNDDDALEKIRFGLYESPEQYDFELLDDYSVEKKKWDKKLKNKHRLFNSGLYKMVGKRPAWARTRLSKKGEK